MGDTHPDGVDRGVGTSNPMPGDDLASLMSKMMADLRKELRENQADLRRDLKENQVTMHATQNVLFEDLKELKENQMLIRANQESIHANQNILHEEITALKEARPSRSTTPKSDSICHNVFEGNNEEGENYDWRDYGGRGGGRNGNGYGYGMNGRVGNGNGRRRNRGPENHGMQEYGNYRGNDRYRRERYFEEETRPRYNDPAKSIKHTFPEFHGKFDPEAYMDWESQVDKIFSLHNYSDGDKVKIAIAEFHGYANTWWNDTMRRRRMGRIGEMGSWEELCELMRGTFVPKSYYLKLRGELQDLRQRTKSVMEYYYELLSLMSKVEVEVEEPEEATQDRFIHGLNITLKHKVQVEALRGISLSEVLGFAETFERQGKELATSRTRMKSSQSGGGAGASKWNTQIKKVEEPTHASAQVKTLLGPQPTKATLPTENKKVQCFKCKGFGHCARECPNQRVMVIGQDGSVYGEDEEDGVIVGKELENEKLRAFVVLRMLNVQPDLEEHKEQRCNIFHMKCKVKSKT